LADGLPFRLPSFLNRFSHHLTRQIFWQGFRSADRLARRQVLQLQPAPLWGPYRSTYLQGMPTLYGFSPSVIPPPPDWGEDTHVTGYWFLDPDQGWQPNSGLLAFLESGPPPVYVGFGSMGNRNPQATAALVARALDMSGQRAVLSSGWGGMEVDDLPESVFLVGSVPHTWLFPRMASVVHHGGAGTTAAGLRAGVPSVVVPFFGDQPFWGRRVHELGAGPEPIPRRHLSAGRLARAIENAVSDPGMSQRAAELGARIRNEDGLARAAAVIGQLDNPALSPG
jgi:UDP:flavonoid glycosyltransferase YjiC (YdhE family)